LNFFAFSGFADQFAEKLCFSDRLVYYFAALPPLFAASAAEPQEF